MEDCSLAALTPSLWLSCTSWLMATTEACGSLPPPSPPLVLMLGG